MIIGGPRFCNARHILLVHFGSWFYNDMKRARWELLRLGKGNGINIHIGYDGMELDVDMFI